MISHQHNRATRIIVVTVRVHATRIADLRDSVSMDRMGVDPTLASQPWQESFEEGKTPLSWKVREMLEARGALGLIDPSRKVPGLWHLTLFTWNCPGCPTAIVGHPDSDNPFEESTKSAPL